MPHSRISAIVGGQIVTPTGVGPGSVVISDGIIERVAPAGTISEGPALDATGLLVSPGYIDVQCNGAHGIDLAAEPERLWELALVLPEYGVTSFLPTIVSSPSDVGDRARKALGQPPEDFLGAVPLGLHLEGPMLNPERRGAHAEGHLRRASDALVAGWSRESGVVMVTLAPELPGALGVVRALCRRGVIVSAGHTDASTAEMLAGIDAGVTAVTHLFNAMAPLVHREPGPVGVALSDSRLISGVIVDGVHLHPTAVAAAHAALGPDRLAVVTDAVAALGRETGNGFPKQVRTRDGRLMGSVVGMDQAVRNLMTFTGCEVEVAITSATATPSRMVRFSNKGSVAPGRDADLLLLTPNLDVVATVVGGRVVVDKIS